MILEVFALCYVGSFLLHFGAPFPYEMKLVGSSLYKRGEALSAVRSRQSRPSLLLFPVNKQIAVRGTAVTWLQVEVRLFPGNVKQSSGMAAGIARRSCSQVTQQAQCCDTTAHSGAEGEHKEALTTICSAGAVIEKFLPARIC